MRPACYQSPPASLWSRVAPRAVRSGRRLLSPEEISMTSRIRLGIALATIATLGLLALGCGGAGTGGGGNSSDELVIGEFGSLTGGEATFGGSTRDGVALALAELTSQKQGKIGGLNGRLGVEDAPSKPQGAATAVYERFKHDPDYVR